MDLLIIRHGLAEERETWARTGKSDDLRPLTEKGRKKMKRAARGLKSIVPEIGLLASSPLTRAKETAEIVAAEYGVSVGAETNALEPDASFDGLVEWLRPLARERVVAVVGHEPQLSGVATWLMCGVSHARVTMRKGGACLLSFDGEAGRGAGTMHWLLTSKQLEALGGG